MYKITLLIACAFGAYLGWAMGNHLNQMSIEMVSKINYLTDFEHCVLEYESVANNEMICLHLTSLDGKTF